MPRVSCCAMSSPPTLCSCEPAAHFPDRLRSASVAPRLTCLVRCVFVYMLCTLYPAIYMRVELWFDFSTFYILQAPHSNFPSQPAQSFLFEHIMRLVFPVGHFPIRYYMCQEHIRVYGRLHHDDASFPTVSPRFRVPAGEIGGFNFWLAGLAKSFVFEIPSLLL